MKEEILVKSLEGWTGRQTTDPDPLTHSQRLSCTSAPELITELPSLDYVLMLFLELLWENTFLDNCRKVTSTLAMKVYGLFLYVLPCCLREVGNASEEVLRELVLLRGMTRGFSVSRLVRDYASNHFSFHSECWKIRVKNLKQRNNYYIWPFHLW